MRLGVFAPSGIFDPARLDAGMERARALGLELVPSPHLGARWRYLAGDDEERLADLQWALSDPGLDGAWMARGGYGLARLLDRVDWSAVKDRPVLGFSDGTALLAALWQRAGVRGWHAPVLTQLGVLEEHNLGPGLSLPAESWRGTALRGGQAEGPLVGGNLCVLASLCGTPDQLRADGCVLLLEEIGEPAYKLDRLLDQLRRAGVFAGVRAVVVGDLTDCRADHPLEEVFLDRLPEVPVLWGVPVGHGKRNRAFRHGAAVRLDGDALHLPAFEPGATT